MSERSSQSEESEVSESEETFVTVEEALAGKRRVSRKPTLESVLVVNNQLLRRFDYGWARAVITDIRLGRVRSNCELRFFDEGSARRNTMLNMSEYFTGKKFESAIIGSWFLIK